MKGKRENIFVLTVIASNIIFGVFENRNNTWSRARAVYSWRLNRIENEIQSNKQKFFAVSPQTSIGLFYDKVALAAGNPRRNFPPQACAWKPIGSNLLFIFFYFIFCFNFVCSNAFYGVKVQTKKENKFSRIGKKVGKLYSRFRRHDRRWHDHRLDWVERITHGCRLAPPYRHKLSKRNCLKTEWTTCWSKWKTKK